MSSPVSISEFLTRAKKVHGNKYDYSKVEYQGTAKHITIICPIHGEFIQRAYDHAQGMGCSFCTGKRSDKGTFIEKANKIHNKRYDYSKSIFVNIDTELIVTCPEHGDFNITPRRHLYGVRRAKDKAGVCNGCPQWGIEQKQLNAQRYFKGYGELPLLLYNRIKNGAKRKSRTLDFNVSIEYLWNLFLHQGRRCALSGLPIEIVNSNNNHHTASLDRKDSMKGYVEGNVQWVHKDVNKMKMDLDEQYFIKLCKSIAICRKR